MSAEYRRSRSNGTADPRRRCHTASVRHNPLHAETDVDVVRELIAENPWAAIVSEAGGELVASHYPALLDDGDELAIVTHVGA